VAVTPWADTTTHVVLNTDHHGIVHRKQNSIVCPFKLYLCHLFVLQNNIDVRHVLQLVTIILLFFLRVLHSSFTVNVRVYSVYCMFTHIKTFVHVVM